jgi:hypothetical protein
VGDYLMPIHMTYWYKKGVVYFRTSDGREGSEPATLATYQKVIIKIGMGLGLSAKDSVEDIT